MISYANVVSNRNVLFQDYIKAHQKEPYYAFLRAFGSIGYRMWQRQKCYRITYDFKIHYNHQV